jgi:P27 family predicted phage terminase small subunit
MKRGRKPQNKPSHLKMVSERPLPPDHVANDPVALRRWEFVCDSLGDQGNLSATDSHLLELYATTYSHWLRMSEQLKTEDTVLVSDVAKRAFVNPLVQHVKSYGQLLDRLLDQLSLTPSRRGKADSSADDGGFGKWKDIV